MSDQRKIKGDETKSKILNATIDLISKEGISSISTKKIAEQAGISKSNVFHHYASVGDIMSALVCDLCNHMTDTLLKTSYNKLELLFKSIGDHFLNLDEKTSKYYQVMYSFCNERVFYEQYKDMLINQKKDTIKYIKNIIL